METKSDTLIPALGLAAGLALSIVYGAHAQAQAFSPRAERVQALGQKLEAVEGQVSATDLHALDYYIGAIESVLGRYSVAPQQRFVCVSNGEPGSFERFRLFNRLLEKTIGGETDLARCLNTISE